MGRSNILQSKWIVGTKPDHKVSQAARVVLCQRLAVTQQYIRLAAKRTELDVEQVHQLRISTRRSQAALQVFEDVLPQPRGRKVGKQLKKLRRAAGAVRDVDVLVSRLARRAETSSDSRLAKLVDQLRELRCSAREELDQARKRVTRKKLEASISEVLESIQWRSPEPEPTFITFAQDTYRGMANAFLAAATADLSVEGSLHGLRLAGKKLRYTMELFAGVFEPSFQNELYPAVQEIQDKLGRINDHVTAALLLDKWRESVEHSEPEFSAAVADEERGFAESTGQRFRDWWTPSRIDKLREDLEAEPTARCPPTIRSPNRNRGIA